MISQNQLLSLLPHEELNPKIWKGEKLDPNIRRALLKIANEFYIFLNVTAPVDDVIFTGSLANFNYTKFSDIDIHILIDFSSVDENQDLVKKYMMSKKSIWNDRHDIRIKGAEVEMYPQDEKITGELRAGGVYSIVTDTWVKKPKHTDVDIDIECVRSKTECLMYEIDSVLKDTNRLPKIDKIKDKIRNMRLAGLERSGEFSVENLSFKLLRRNGYLNKLYDIGRKDYDDSLSLSQEGLLREYIKAKFFI